MCYFRFLVTVNRIAMRPFTFSNGFTVPAGTLIAAPSGVIHKDGEIYPNPDEFDGFRFVKLRELNEDAVARYQAFSTSTDHLTFGYGRHTWCAFFCLSPPQSLIFAVSPGRAFAVNEIKLLLAHVVVTYDIKFEEGKQTPRYLCIGSGRFPGNTNAMFRKRQK
jgi:hypothetical protein